MRIPGTTRSRTIGVKTYAADRARAGFEAIADFTYKPLGRPRLSDRVSFPAGLEGLLTSGPAKPPATNAFSGSKSADSPPNIILLRRSVSNGSFAQSLQKKRLKSIRWEIRLPHRMLNVLMAQIILHRRRIVPLVNGPIPNPMAVLYILRSQLLSPGRPLPQEPICALPPKTSITSPSANIGYT